MKIHPKLHTERSSATSGKEKAATGKAGGNSSGPATRLALSSDANWVGSLRAEPSSGAVRADVVAETRALIENGTFENSVDLERAVDALLADL